LVKQISCKKGGLAIVVSSLSKWKNRELVDEVMDEIVDVHSRYKSFAAMSQPEAITYYDRHYTP